MTSWGSLALSGLLFAGQSHTSQFAVGTDFQRKMMPVDQLLASARDIAGMQLTLMYAHQQCQNLTNTNRVTACLR